MFGAAGDGECEASPFVRKNGEEIGLEREVVLHGRAAAKNFAPRPSVLPDPTMMFMASGNRLVRENPRADIRREEYPFSVRRSSGRPVNHISAEQVRCDCHGNARGLVALSFGLSFSGSAKVTFRPVRGS